MLATIFGVNMDAFVVRDTCSISRSVNASNQNNAELWFHFHLLGAQQFKGSYALEFKSLISVFYLIF
jgi:hypothetical protein